MVGNEVDRLCFKVLQAQQHDLRCVLKEGGSVLLLPFLHPVAVDTEGAAIDEFADAAKGVRIPGEHLPSQWASFAVTAVHPDTSQHADYQHPKCLSGAEESHILLLVLSKEGMCQGLLRSETYSWLHHQQSGYQIFHSVRPIIPLWGAKLVATLHDHPQHQHLFAMPERW